MYSTAESALLLRPGQSYRARTIFFETNGKFRERHLFSLKKMNVCMNSLAVHGLKITTNECTRTGFFVKNAVL